MAEFVEYNIPDHINGTTWNGMTVAYNVDGETDITDIAIHCAFRYNNEEGTLVKTLSVGSGITKTDAVNGLFKLDKQLIDFSEGAGTYYYDILFISSTDKKVWVKGQWKITPKVTPTPAP